MIRTLALGLLLLANAETVQYGEIGNAMTVIGFLDGKGCQEIKYDGARSPVLACPGPRKRNLILTSTIRVDLPDRMETCATLYEYDEFDEYGLRWKTTFQCTAPAAQEIVNDWDLGRKLDIFWDDTLAPLAEWIRALPNKS